MKDIVDTIDRCTACSICMTACPVTRATRCYLGPKMTGPSSERFRLLTDLEIEALEYCSNCKNCDVACPGNVRISTLNMLARAEACRRRRPPLRDWVLSHGHALGKATRFVPQGLLRWGMTNPLTRVALDAFGVDRRAPMPVYARRNFMAMFKRHRQPSSDRKVLFFPGCYIDDYDPSTGMDVVFLLNRAGYEVVVPTDRCCGVPLVANGFLDEARASAERIIAVLRPFLDRGVPVVAACTSCSLMLRTEYGELFGGPDGADLLSGLTRDAGEFLLEAADRGELTLPDLRHGRTLYHMPCHLRAQAMGSPCTDLLREAGMAVADAGADCCGISGSYGFKKEKYDVAYAIGRPLFDTVDAAVRDGVATCVSECGTCRLQIGWHTKARVRHPLSLLCDALREREAEQAGRI